MHDALPPLDAVRYEVLPFPRAESEAAEAPRPLTLTVTCSPQQGVDPALDVACRLRRLGHVVVLHLAARMVRGPGHLDRLLERMAAGGIADVFLVGGDAPAPQGPYPSGAALLDRLREHPLAPRTIGVPAYPEGHPLVDAPTLAGALRDKAPLADYMVTQICFDADALRRWLEETRAAGVDLPLYAGLPGAVDRRRLLEVSMRVGVGASIRFIRKQRGVRRLFGRPVDAAGELAAALAPLDGVAGLHFFTFNRLVATARFADRLAVPHDATARPPAISQERHTT
jgi:methylenetetrahydrofolate reductase (NADPH)